MRVIEFDTIIKSGNSIEIPSALVNSFKENEHIKVILLKEDADDKEWSKIATNSLFNLNETADDIYETLRKK